MIYYRRSIEGRLLETIKLACPENQCWQNCQRPDCARDVGYTVIADTRTWLRAGGVQVLCDDVVDVRLLIDTGPVTYRYYSCESAFQELLQRADLQPLLYYPSPSVNKNRWVFRWREISDG